VKRNGNPNSNSGEYMSKFDEDKWEKNISIIRSKKIGDIISIEDYIAIAECFEMLHKTKKKFVFR
jgi:hypothetical protein